MATYSYTTSDAITALAGQIAIDLRTDDADGPTLVAAAIAFATAQIDWYCEKYAQDQIAANQFAQDAATFMALKWLCERRLNSASAGLLTMWRDDWEPKLEQIAQGKRPLPRASGARNPVGVTNYSVDLRRPNNQIRVDKSRSTGIAQDYKRPIDTAAPDSR